MLLKNATRWHIFSMHIYFLACKTISSHIEIEQISIWEYTMMLNLFLLFKQLYFRLNLIDLIVWVNNDLASVQASSIPTNSQTDKRYLCLIYSMIDV